MEENAIISNIATILTKDILIDENRRRSAHCFQLPNASGSVAYPLLDSDDDEAFTFFLQQQQLLGKSNYAKATKKMKHKAAGNKSQKQLQRINIELNLLNQFQTTEFEGHLHMSKMTFLKIFQAVRQLLLNVCDSNVLMAPPQTIFSLSMWKLSTDDHFEKIARLFAIPLQHCKIIIRQFWCLVANNMQNFVKFPTLTQLQQSMIQGFQSHVQLKMLPQLFGILALKRLDVFFEYDDAEVTVVLQIICNADQKIVDCAVEVAHEYNFDDTPIGRKLASNAQMLPAGSYLVGDRNFPLRQYLMRPFDVGCDGETELKFNRLLEPAFMLAQQVLDAMAKRFNALYALEAQNLSEMIKIMKTVCALYNLCVEIEDDFVERNCSGTEVSWSSNTATDVPNKKVCEEHESGGLARRSNLILEIFR